jgi:glycosyltransferase involved in cell wall biosynthesis
MDVQATIIIPTHDHGPTLRRSVGSALRQTVRDIEVFVIGDGVPDATRELLADMMRGEPRLKFFDHPKHESRAEPHRHAAIVRGRGRIICYLSDDDLYLPRHVETMLGLLADADFAHALPVHVTAEGHVGAWTVDLTLDEHRRLLRNVQNRIPFSAGAHTRDAYCRLTPGWRTPPAGVFSDLHMWRQFLGQEGCRFASAAEPTVLVFPSPLRRGWTLEQRVTELDQWCVKLSRPDGENAILRELLSNRVREAARHDAAFLERQRTAAEAARAVAELRSALASERTALANLKNDSHRRKRKTSVPAAIARAIRTVTSQIRAVGGRCTATERPR